MAITPEASKRILIAMLVVVGLVGTVVYRSTSSKQESDHASESADAIKTVQFQVNRPWELCASLGDDGSRTILNPLIIQEPTSQLNAE